MKKLLSLFLLFTACSGPEPTNQVPHVDNEKLREQFMEANNELAVREDEAIAQYASRRHLPLVSTPSGIRYFVYKPSEKGDSIREGMLVSMDYTLSLLDGTVCYTSDEEGRKALVVGQQEAESGLHRGLQYLKKGDKALLVIPSALAHGLLGDFKKIPPHMPIVYNIKTY